MIQRKKVVAAEPPPAQQPKEHPIDLEKVVFTNVAVRAIPGYDPEKQNPPVQPDNRINVSPIEGDPGAYAATMTTIINPKGEPTEPYGVVIECLGILRADMTQLSEKEARTGRDDHRAQRSLRSHP